MTNERDALLQNSSQIPGQALRRRRKPSKIISIIYVLTFCICVVLFRRWRRATVPDFIDHDFGVGFDLTYPYGTAAISYANGTVSNVAKISGSNDYQKMMLRLSLDSSKRLHNDPNSLSDYVDDTPRRCLRKARKALGLPASSDVGTLAKFILALRASVEKHLDGSQISGAVATVPHLAALYPDDLEDAFEYAGLIYIAQYPYWRGAFYGETAAVYAANGYGLCSNYTDPSPCDDERRNPPPHRPQPEYLLSVSYTSGMLTSTWASVGMWFAASDGEYPAVTDMQLGWHARHKNPREEFYWAAVRDAIITPVLKSFHYQREHWAKVLLHGDCALDEDFQNVFRKAIESTSHQNIEILAMDPLYSASRGAAEMAKRVYWTYNHTLKTGSCVGCGV